MPQCHPPSGSKFTIMRVSLMFLEVCNFTTFCDRKGYKAAVSNAEQNIWIIGLYLFKGQDYEAAADILSVLAHRPCKRILRGVLIPWSQRSSTRDMDTSTSSASKDILIAGLYTADYIRGAKTASLVAAICRLLWACGYIGLDKFIYTCMQFITFLLLAAVPISRWSCLIFISGTYNDGHLVISVCV